MWSHPDSPEPTMKDQRNGIEMGYHKTLKYQEMRFTNTETLLYTFHYFKFQRNIHTCSQDWQLGMQEGFLPHTHSSESNESQHSCLFPSLFNIKMILKMSLRDFFIFFSLVQFFKANLCTMQFECSMSAQHKQIFLNVAF